MSQLLRTPLYDRHTALKAKMVEFGGWDMPVFYPTGIVTEHLTTRKEAGLFDVSHMGRFILRGGGTIKFLQHVLTNNAEALDVGQSQYTIIPNENGGAVDDAYLYRFYEDEYLLVVNASNREKDWEHFQKILPGFPDVQLTDRTSDLVMLALQGPKSKEIIYRLIESGQPPEPMRNYLSVVKIAGTEVMVGRTGYTGEPLCFECFLPTEDGPRIWDLFLKEGASPIGLGARDTLRLEAGLPLYGHEFGADPDGREIPIMACPLAKYAVSFSPLKGDFIGRQALERQHEALGRIIYRDFSDLKALPRIIKPFAMTGRGVGREGAPVFRNGRPVGYVTSGTTVPMWEVEGEGLSSMMTDEKKLRAIGLALIDSDIIEDDEIIIEIRKKQVEAVVVPFHLRSEAPPYARPIVYGRKLPEDDPKPGNEPAQALKLLEKAAANTKWRQRECINLIPSEMTQSPMARLLTVMDPAFRYAEHRKSEAFYEADIFYYQGTEFISEVERLLEAELIKFLGCEEVETRIVSGQMANVAVFSAMVDYINRADRKVEQRRIGMIMNNHIGKGGHLSAQPMGALRDFVARDPRTEKPAVVNFPVLPDNRYKIDLKETFELLEKYPPELIIFGKSMVIHKEPVAEVRKFIDDQGIDAVIMYDMAHVIGLVGTHFQQPFAEGADLVTGSTHKTYFGTQRGMIGSRYKEEEERYELWEALRRRTFPGSVSNHHLGSMVGLLLAAYEMNHFKDQYQPKVVANAKAFARALKDSGLNVAGDPAIDFTETHQVIIDVGYARGAEISQKLEENNIICNYQAMPDEESFTASGALRTGVSEMTRFGMEAEDFRTLASLIAEVVLKGRDVGDEVKKLRSQFQELKFCFKGREYEDVIQKLHGLI